MKKTRKMIALLIIMVMMLAMLPLNMVIAGVTDTVDGKIIRKTTTNYFTTVKIEGTLNNEKTGEAENFTKSSDELSGNISDENVIAMIESLKNDFNTWAQDKGVETKNINFSSESIEDYYYDAHDEITESKTDTDGNNDVILVGDIDDLDNAYAAQGTVTIETILDKHQTYTIKATGIIEDSGIKRVNITLTAPTVGDKVTSTVVGDKNMGEFKQDNKPIASTSDNITIDDTTWIKGTYPLVGDDYMDAISTTFEKDTYYYAMISISAKSGYTLSSNLSIKVNGEAPAEVFAVYNNDNTYFIAKIKAVEKVTEKTKDEAIKYKVLNGDNQKVDIGKNEELTFRFDIKYSDFLASGKVYVDEKEVSNSNYTSKEGSTIITFNDEYKNTLSVGEHTVKVTVADGEVSTKFTIAKTEKATDTEETTVTENTTTETKTTTASTNPKTGDNIIAIITIFAIATLGVFTTKKFNKNRKVRKK